MILFIAAAYCPLYAKISMHPYGMVTHYKKDGGKMKSGDVDGNNDRKGTYRVANADPAAVLQYIKNCSYGEHNLILYPCLGQFEEFYIESCKDSILEKNEIFIVISQYQHVSVVRKKINQAGIDTERYENDGRLVIVDSEIAYQRAPLHNSLYNISSLITASVRQAEAIYGKGITLLTDLGTFILNNRIADLVLYEVSLPRVLDFNIKAFCCYHKDDFNILREEQRKMIFAHHSINLFVA